ncbi:MAG: ABC transporter ATP-binding protein [Bradyrhizobiaceae bacterium]|nr:MAG: ABC transporter ATP-binding protein [Bradyrhizobiaceae bacterium]
MVLRVQGVQKAYRTAGETVLVLCGADLSMTSGESVALTGESGSGKSTLLHLIAGLDRLDAGEIWLEDSLISAMSDRQLAGIRQGRIGLVFQQFNLVPSLTVEDNLAFQARIADRFDAAWQDELASRLGLQTLLKRYPEQLSGGQQQRVAIGRALAVRPKLLLADEPTGNLDEATGDSVFRLMLDLVRHTGCSLLMATHSVRLAEAMDRRLHLRGGVLT